MVLIKRFAKGAAILSGLLLFLPLARAEQPFDFTLCSSGTQTILSATEGLTVTSYDSSGILMSNLEDKTFNNMTAH